MTRIFAIFFIGILFSLPLSANEKGVIVRLANVYSESSSLSGKQGRIEAGSEVSIFERKGGWKLIFSETKDIFGWVRSYEVREGYNVSSPTVKTESDSRGFLSGLAAFSRKASGFFGSSNESSSSARTATIGVRGLSEVEITAARPDFDELEKMHGFSSDSKRQSIFGKAGHLKTTKISHLKPGKK